jgi:acetyltransferase-like isoleucine patch superfamily enzyme
MSKHRTNNSSRRGIKKRIQFFFKVNWYKTLYFNFKMLPFSQAKKLPFYFYGKVKFSSLNGSVKIEAPIKRAMIGFGQPYEMNTTQMGIAELILSGTLIFKGYTQFGKDYFIFIKKEATCSFGNMSSLGSRGKVICTNSIALGDYARLGSECQIIDTNFHKMINTVSLEEYDMSHPIVIGNYNFISNRVTLLSKTKTPDYCTIASNTLCNKDYQSLGNNILVGGVPASLLKENISRDWKGEQTAMLKNLIMS